jgi:hypothetical protein
MFSAAGLSCGGFYMGRAAVVILPKNSKTVTQLTKLLYTKRQLCDMIKRELTCGDKAGKFWVKLLRSCWQVGRKGKEQ